jgi:RNA polymerase sigma-70 factor (ECF subfamily)
MVFADPREGSERSMEREQLQEVIARAIATVPEKYRFALVLRDVEGMAYEEIAVVLGVPGGTVRSRINRARNMLKRKLQPLLRKDGTTS